MPAKKRRKRPLPAEARPSVLDRRTRIIGAVLIGFAVVLALWGRHKSAAPPPALTAAETEPTSTTAFRTTPGGSPAGDPTAAPTGVPTSTAPPEPPPVIDEIVLEKKEVCAGEENLVTVKAHTTNGTDPFLHTVIDGHQGSSWPMTLWRDEDGNVMGTHTVTVFGRGNVATSVPLPQYEVMDCRPTYIAAVSQRLRSNTWSDFDFQARVVPIPPAITKKDHERGAPPPQVPKPFKPVAYTWTFGDGQSEVSLGPLIQHTYEGRAQSALYSYFLVGVSIRGAKGETATGRMTLSLINPAFEALSGKGIVALLISLDPRFPEVTNGKVIQKVRIWHTQPGPVTIDRAILTKFYRQAAGETDPVVVDVASVLGTAVIPPGKDGITTTVTLDPEAEEEIFAKTWALNGTSAEGFPAMGSFSVMLPPPKPSADAGDVVFDPVKKQKIILARELLGKDVVNDEDLWRLEREGAFANIKAPTKAEAAAAASAAAAAAIRKGPPGGTQPTSVPRGPAAPSSTAQQVDPGNQGSAGAASTK